jgi:hypothetical protein
LIFQKQPYSKWNELDFILLEAFRIYQDELSQSNGLPMWLGQSIDGKVGFRIETTQNIADKELAEFDKREGDKKNPTKGLQRYAIPVNLEDPKVAVPMGGLAREAYFEAKAKLEEQAREDGYDEGMGPTSVRPGAYDPSEYETPDV